MFKLGMPIRHQVLDSLLQDHPDRKKVQYVVQRFKFGFSLKYKGPLENHQPKNLLSAYQHPGRVIKEVNLSRMLGPFLVQCLDPLICLPVDMVEK